MATDENTSTVQEELSLEEEAEDAVESSSKLVKSKGNALSEVLILVVEDCPDTREAISLILDHLGVTSEYVVNGVECIQAVLAQQRRNETYDLILVDLNLPDMDGCDIAAVLRKHGYTKPLIAMTGTASLERQRSSVHLGFDRFLAKRNFADTILPAIKELVVNDQKDLLL